MCVKWSKLRATFLKDASYSPEQTLSRNLIAQIKVVFYRDGSKLLSTFYNVVRLLYGKELFEIGVILFCYTVVFNALFLG